MFFSSIDRPVPPSMRGYEEFYYDINSQARQLQRTRLFNVNRTDLIEAANKYLKDKKHSIAIFGSDQNRNQFLAMEAWNCCE